MTPTSSVRNPLAPPRPPSHFPSLDALSKGELWSLDMGSLVKANSSALTWTDQEAAGITTTNYDPVMAIAQNHIYFFGVPNNPAGSASIFVIHCASRISYHAPPTHPFLFQSRSGNPAPKPTVETSPTATDRPPRSSWIPAYVTPSHARNNHSTHLDHRSRRISPSSLTMARTPTSSTSM